MLRVLIYDEQVEICNPMPQTKIKELYQDVYTKYPVLVGIKFDFYYEGEKMDDEKTVQEYGFSWQTPNIQI